MTNRKYRSEKINEVDVENLRKLSIVHGSKKLSVGLDVAKEEVVVCPYWEDRTASRPWSVPMPSCLGQLISVLQELSTFIGDVQIGMESTGTYGEVTRQALTEAGLDVYLVRGKSVFDYQEIYDGVPSQHDPKDAAIIAELLHNGKGKPWPYRPLGADEKLIETSIKLADMYSKAATQWSNRMEAELAKYWPEASALFGSITPTLANICKHYGSPAALASSEDAFGKLREWSRGGLSAVRVKEIIESARKTVGLAATGHSVSLLQTFATEHLDNREKQRSAKKTLERLLKADDFFGKYVSDTGSLVLASILATIGNPKNFASSGAFVKAAGLNLKEQSSGKSKGQLSVTKRGPSIVRKFVYLWAMRTVQKAGVRTWYYRYKTAGLSQRDKDNPNCKTPQGRGVKGLIAVMRKLLKGLWYAMKHSEKFDLLKVFPGKPLGKRTRTRDRNRDQETPEQCAV